ncbi:MAG: PH domain-containing protein [Mycobacteriales bacterium]
MSASPSPWYGGLLAALGVALAVVALGTDPLGRVLLVPAALLLVGTGARDLLLRPTLTADEHGLSVVDGVRRRQVPWEQLERVRVVRDRRTPVLELDLGAHLVVLSRRRLGAHPDVVLTDLERLRPAS